MKDAEVRIMVLENASHKPQSVECSATPESWDVVVGHWGERAVKAEARVKELEGCLKVLHAKELADALNTACGYNKDTVRLNWLELQRHGTHTLTLTYPRGQSLRETVDAAMAAEETKSHE